MVQRAVARPPLRLAPPGNLRAEAGDLRRVELEALAAAPAAPADAPRRRDQPGLHPTPRFPLGAAEQPRQVVRLDEALLPGAEALHLLAPARARRLRRLPGRLAACAPSSRSAASAKRRAAPASSPCAAATSRASIPCCSADKEMPASASSAATAASAASGSSPSSAESPRHRGVQRREQRRVRWLGIGDGRGGALLASAARTQTRPAPLRLLDQTGGPAAPANLAQRRAHRGGVGRHPPLDQPQQLRPLPRRDRHAGGFDSGLRGGPCGGNGRGASRPWRRGRPSYRPNVLNSAALGARRIGAGPGPRLGGLGSETGRGPVAATERARPRFRVAACIWASCAADCHRSGPAASCGMAIDSAGTGR